MSIAANDLWRLFHGFFFCIYCESFFSVVYFKGKTKNNIEIEMKGRKEMNDDE